MGYEDRDYMRADGPRRAAPVAAAGDGPAHEPSYEERFGRGRRRRQGSEPAPAAGRFAVLGGLLSGLVVLAVIAGVGWVGYQAVTAWLRPRPDVYPVFGIPWMGWAVVVAVGLLLALAGEGAAPALGAAGGAVMGVVAMLLVLALFEIHPSSFAGHQPGNDTDGAAVVVFEGVARQMPWLGVAIWLAVSGGVSLIPAKAVRAMGVANFMIASSYAVVKLVEGW
jgi:hypothetical protein